MSDLADGTSIPRAQLLDKLEVLCVQVKVELDPNLKLRCVIVVLQTPIRISEARVLGGRRRFRRRRSQGESLDILALHGARGKAVTHLALLTLIGALLATEAVKTLEKDLLRVNVTIKRGAVARELVCRWCSVPHQSEGVEGSTNGDAAAGSGRYGWPEMYIREDLRGLLSCREQSLL
jgi:hypothetical protein